MSQELVPIVSIVGPTASGKTELAVNLALKFGGEIISADSMQIYKEFEISTAKPTKKQKDTIVHHMVDFLSVTEEFSVAKFSDMVHKHIYSISCRGKLPFLVGGTGLYIDSVLKDIKFENFEKRNKNNVLVDDNLTNEELMQILQKIDFISSQKIHVNDRKRLKRAIEFFYTTGYPISMQTENSLKIISPYKVCKIGVNFKNRDILYDKINFRVDKMFESGIVEEISRISNLNISKTAQAAIGYKELLPFIKGECTEMIACEKLKQATRRYAKRQLTWFRRDKDINWIYCDEYSDFMEITAKACMMINDFLD